MDTIWVRDKQFRILIPATDISREVRRVGKDISRDMEGKNPLFLSILKGSFIFAADLLREISIPCEICFNRVSSYSGMQSTKQIIEILGLDKDIKGRHVVIIEDIVDSGFTMKSILEKLYEQEPASVNIASFMVKPENLQVELDIRYKCFEVANDFIVGYGMDYNEYGRNLPNAYIIVEE